MCHSASSKIGHGLTYATITGILLIAIFIFVFRKRKTIVSATTPVESVNLDQPETKIPASSTESYVKLSDEEAGDVIHTLKKYMQDQQPYLNVDLKQSDVAAAIGYPTYLLSAVFTHYLKWVLRFLSIVTVLRNLSRPSVKDNIKNIRW